MSFLSADCSNSYLLGDTIMSIANRGLQKWCVTAASHQSPEQHTVTIHTIHHSLYRTFRLPNILILARGKTYRRDFMSSTVMPTIDMYAMFQKIIEWVKVPSFRNWPFERVLFLFASVYIRNPFHAPCLSCIHRLQTTFTTTREQHQGAFMHATYS